MRSVRARGRAGVPAFGDQFLCVEATPGRGAPRDSAREVDELVTLAARFAAEYRHKVEYWQSCLAGLRAAGRRVALWGAGSKGITFVNTVAGGDEVACLVDLNPRKQGRFVPGTGQPVVAPETLKQMRPDVIMVMNPLYRQEIGQLMNQLGLQCHVEVA